MPILGLFPTGRENDYQSYVDQRARGAETAATRELRQAGELARRQAFSSAYAARGNQALARRQANQEATQATLSSGAQIGNQKLRDIEAAKMEQQRLEQQRTAGINNAIGYAAQGAGLLFGGPAGGSVAKKALNGFLGNDQPNAAKPEAVQKPAAVTSPPQSAAMGPPVSDADIMSLAGPRQAPQPMRQDLQQYMDPNVALESGSRLNTDVSGLAQRVGDQLTPEYLLQGLDPRLLRGIRQSARR